MVRKRCFLFLLASVALATLAVAQDAFIVSPTTTVAPRIDGRLGEAAWPATPQITNFAVVGTLTASPKPIRVWICHDARALYLAFEIAEPQPQRLKHTAMEGSRNVWQDDCVEIFLRVSDSSLDYDQFIVNCTGVRQSERCRNGRAASDWRPEWQAAAAMGAQGWIVEVAIPFATLEMSPPTPGTMIQLALGREDYTKTGPALVNWPPGGAYGAQGRYGRLYFERENMLTNPDFSAQQEGRIVGWSFGDEGRDARFFSSIEEAGERAIRFQSPGRYCVAQQTLRLRPQAIYRLEAEIRGTAGAYLRARTAARRGEPTTPYDINVRPTAQYQRVQLTFPTGETGEALIILGATESTGVGELFIRRLKVVQEISLAADGPAIPVRAGQTLRIVKLLVADCRACRGFVTAPVDGRLDSYNWDMGRWEYNQRGAGAGVGYAYNNNEGLHITLADSSGVDAVQIREGVRVKLYAGAERYDRPGKAPLLWTFQGHAKSSRALFPQRVRSARFSFFELTDGLIADCAFFRLERTGPKGRPGAPLSVADRTDPGYVQEAATRRFPEAERLFYRLEEGAPRPLALPARQAVQLLTAPLSAETSLDAVAIHLKTASPVVICPLRLAIQDPFNPLHELMGVECDLQAGQDFDIVLDFPDQVVPAGRPLWLTLTAQAATDLTEIAVTPYFLDREQAIPEALAYRQLLMRGLFCQLSEARQWTTLRRNTDLERFYKENHWGPGIRELHEAIAYCRALAPQDELGRVYEEWVWRTVRDLPPWPLRIDSVPGAPEWAVLLRQTWLANRAVCDWWLQHRLTPTGEFGGEVGDDTDMYQNYADLPMFEDGGVGAAVKAAAANLAELAERETLAYGLNKRTMDPLHAYEEGVNHEALMLWWHYGDPVYFERCLQAAKSLPATTIVTEKGHRHFKSQLIGAEDLRLERPLDVDGDAHPLMWHPALEVAWYNGSPAVLKYLDEWASGWLEHHQPGQYATAVDVKTETVKEAGPRPLNGGYGGQATVHTFLYFLTNNEKYLEPFLYYFRRGERQWPMHNFLPELYQRGLLDALPNRQDWLDKHPVLAAIALGRKEALCEALKADLTELQRFWWMYTGAEVFTDRVFLTTLINTAIAYTGGFATRNKFNHTHAVSWEGLGTDYAALVLTARRDRFQALIYNFAPRPLTGRFRLWLLDHGRYRLRQGIDANGDDQLDQPTRDEIVEVARATALPLTLPPRQITVVELTQLARLDDITQRADLALSPREITIEGQRLRGVVHNIGAHEASAVVVVLVDAQGKRRAEQRLGPLAAPVDLQPKRVPFVFRLPQANVKGWRLIVDPTNAVPEIYEGNNAVRL